MKRRGSPARSPKRTVESASSPRAASDSAWAPSTCGRSSRCIPRQPASCLLTRARAAQPGFELPPGSDAAIAELLERLDRLPLAIEMAAARLPTLALDELVELLRHRLDLLRSADRAADARHRTISELIGWSEELLDEARARRTHLPVDLRRPRDRFGHRRRRTDRPGGVDERRAWRAPSTSRWSWSTPCTSRPRIGCWRRSVRAPRNDGPTPTTRGMRRRVIDVASEMGRVLRTPDEATAARRLDDLVADMRIAHRWTIEHDHDQAGELTAALLHFAYERQWTEPVRWAEQVMASTDDDHPALRTPQLPRARPTPRTVATTNRRARSPSVRSLAPTPGCWSAPTTRSATSACTTATSRPPGTTSRSSGRSRPTTMTTPSRRPSRSSERRWSWPTEAIPNRRSAISPSIARPGPISPTAAAWITYIEADALAALGRADAAIARFDDAMQLAVPVGSSFVRSVSELSSLAARSRAGNPAEAIVAFVPVLTHYRRIRSTTHADHRVAQSRRAPRSGG